MATSRSVGYKVSASVWNAVLTSINDAGTIWSGAVAGTTVSGSTISATTSLSIASAVDNGGVFINASGTNRPVVSFGNTSTGPLGLIQADNTGRLLFYTTNGSVPTFVLGTTGGGGVASGGVTVGNPSGSAPSSGCLHVEGGSITMPNIGASRYTALFGDVGGENGIQMVGGPGTITIQGGAATVALNGTANALNMTGGPSIIYLQGAANGTGAVTGQYVSIGHNTSGGGASGHLAVFGKGGAGNYVWADATAAPGVLRIATAPPEEDGTPSDTSGSVVGAQSSWHEFKSNIVPTTVTPDEALQIILATPIWDFEYPGGGFRDGDNQPIVFTGYVGYDRNDWFLTNAGSDQNPALDEVTVPGYYNLAFKALAARVAALEAR